MTRAKAVVLWISLFIIFFGCENEKHDARFSYLNASDTGISFGNYLEENEDQNIIEYLYYYNGAGVAVSDMNNDGKPDLLIASNQDGVRLYLNTSENNKISFKDITTKAGLDTISGWSTGVSIVDINADGRKDIFICQVGGYKTFSGRNRLLINTSSDDIRFEDQTMAYGLDFTGFSTHAAWFDYDADNDLDMYLLNHSVHETGNYGRAELREIMDEKAGDRLYRNDGGYFTNVTVETGIYSSKIGYGLGVALSDIDQNGYPDIYVANDFHENDYLYLNKGDGTFSEQIRKVTGHTSQFSMGVNIADVNDDGYTDILTLDMKPASETTRKKSVGHDPYEIYEFKNNFGYHYQFPHNQLMINQGIDDNQLPKLSEVSQLKGIDASDWSWCPLIADLNNDGRKDVYITNGIVRRPNDLDYLNYISNPLVQEEASDLELANNMPSGKISNVLFVQNSEGSFERKNEEWGLTTPTISTGAVFSDLDGDGGLDVVTNNINDDVSIIRNDQTNDLGNFLTVRLSYIPGNRSGIGAKVIVYSAEGKAFQEHFPQNGYMSSLSDELHFGLGATKIIDTIKVIWPNGFTQTEKNVAVNQRLNFEYNTQKLELKTSRIKQRILVKDAQSIVDFKHSENAYNDLNREKLMPRKYSSEGPAYARSDVNNDGREDIFIGNSKGMPATLFVQNAYGQFKGSQESFWESQKQFEDTQAIFLDYDEDGDKDLIVGSGGNQDDPNSPALMLRSYNNSDGLFSKDQKVLPLILGNIATLSAADYDGDGDEDLFVGCNIITNTYGIHPQSYLLENVNGKFTINPEVSKILSQIGLINQSKWGDMDKDGDVDLVLVGEWMPITILINEGGGFIKRELTGSSGWYTGLELIDIDGDQVLDILAGNLGKNHDLHISEEYPLIMYVKDFDGNFQTEPIIAHYVDGSYFPLASRDELVGQMPEFKKLFSSYADFAMKTFDEIFSRDILESAMVYEIVESRSALYINRTDFKFVKKPLPNDLQSSVMNDFLVLDVNSDDHLDIIAAGNFHDFNTRIETKDASYGHILIGNGQGEFETMSPRSTGMYLTGVVRHLDTLTVNENIHLIAVKNNGGVQSYSLSF